MTDILFIKTSSLGDVVHHMPAVTESRARFPHARISWLVEEAYAPLAALHPAVDEVIPVAWRRWRKRPLSASVWGEIGEARRRLRARDYDAVIDTQGLIRTALMARAARGRRHGYDRGSIREPLGSHCYDVRHKVSRSLHAIERNRLLSGLALGYQPQGAPDYGLDRARLRSGGEPYAVLLHASARREKEWPATNWIELGKSLGAGGIPLVVPWGNDAERSRASHIVAHVPNARLAGHLPIGDVAKLVAGANFVIGGDTGLLHLAAALGVPLVALFLASEPGLTRPVGAGPMQVLGGKDQMPSIAEVVGALEKIVS